MPLSKYPIEIPLGGAVEEGNVPEIVQPPRVLEAEDCVSIKGGAYQKRDNLDRSGSDASEDAYAVQAAGSGLYVADKDRVQRREGTVVSTSDAHPGGRLDIERTVMGDSPQVQWWNDTAEQNGVIAAVWTESGLTTPGNKSNISGPEYDFFASPPVLGGVGPSTPDVPPGCWGSSEFLWNAPNPASPFPNPELNLGGEARLDSRVWFAVYDAATKEQLGPATDITQFGPVVSVPSTLLSPFAVMPRVRAVPGTSLWCIGVNGVPRNGTIPWRRPAGSAPSGSPLDANAYRTGDYGLLNGNLNMGYRVYLVDSDGVLQNNALIGPTEGGEIETLFEFLYVGNQLYTLTYRDNNELTAPLYDAFPPAPEAGTRTISEAQYTIRQWQGMDSPGPPGAPVASGTEFLATETTFPIPGYPAPGPSGAIRSLPSGMYYITVSGLPRLQVVLSDGRLDDWTPSPLAYDGSTSFFGLMETMKCEPIVTRGVPTQPTESAGGVPPTPVLDPVRTWQWFPSTTDCMKGWTGPSSFLVARPEGGFWMGLQCQRLVDFPGSAQESFFGVTLSNLEGYRIPGPLPELDPAENADLRRRYEFKQTLGGVPYSVPVVLHFFLDDDLIVDESTAGVTVGSRIMTDATVFQGEPVVGIAAPVPSGAVSSYCFSSGVTSMDASRVFGDAQLPSFVVARRVAVEGGDNEEGDRAAARLVALATYAELASNPGTCVHNFCAHKSSMYVSSEGELTFAVDVFGDRVDPATFSSRWFPVLQNDNIDGQPTSLLGPESDAPFYVFQPYLKGDLLALTRGSGHLVALSDLRANPKAASSQQALFGGSAPFSASGPASTAAGAFLQQWVRWPRLQREETERYTQETSPLVYAQWDVGFQLPVPIQAPSAQDTSVSWDIQVYTHVVWYDESPAQHRSLPAQGFFPGQNYVPFDFSSIDGDYNNIEYHYCPVPWELMGIPFEQQMGTEAYVAIVGVAGPVEDPPLSPLPGQIGVSPLPLVPPLENFQQLVSRGNTALRGSGQVLYTDAGELGAGPLPGVRDLTSTTTRVWAVGMSEPGRVFYSKLRRPGYATEWNGNLYLDVSDPEPLVAAAGLPDGRMLFFTAHATYYSLGEGPSDTGQGAGFSQPALLSDDVGCADPRSIAVGDFGVMFRGGRGYYLVDRSLSLKFVGLPYEDTATGPVCASVVDGGRSEVLLCRTENPPIGEYVAGTYVYNYLRDQWSTFTAPWGECYDATAQNGRPVYLGDSPVAPFRSLWRPFIFAAGADNGDPDSLQALRTGWLAMGKIQGFGRVWEVQLSGLREPTSRSGLRVDVLYDYDVVPAETYDFDDVGSGQFKVRFRPRKQKCEAISFRFSEYVPAAEDPEDCRGWRLAMCTVLAGVKAGLDKVAVTVRSS